MSILSESQIEDVRIYTISNKLYGPDSALFHEKMMQLMPLRPEKLLFDMTHVGRIDSLGLRTFIMISTKLKEYGGIIALCGLQDMVKDVFEISGFSAFFKIANTQEEALTALK